MVSHSIFLLEYKISMTLEKRKKIVCLVKQERKKSNFKFV